VIEYRRQHGTKGFNSMKGKRLDGNFRNVAEGAGWPVRILMAKIKGSKGTGDDAAEVFEIRQGNKYGVPRLGY